MGLIKKKYLFCTTQAEIHIFRFDFQRHTLSQEKKSLDTSYKHRCLGKMEILYQFFFYYVRIEEKQIWGGEFVSKG